MRETDSYHQPALVDEAVGYLVTRRDGTYIDATAGDGSHTLAILARLDCSGRILAVDRDDEGVARTACRVSGYSSQVQVVRGDFGCLRELAFDAGIKAVNGILFDLGVSSHQLDSAYRGFSYRETGPLDLRMDRRGEVTAEDIINRMPADDLARIFREYGEEKNARRIASAIIAARQKRPLTTTTELAAVIASVTNPRYVTKTLSRTFQAIRVAVNDELDQLRRGLAAAAELLSIESRMIIISYHSLEDGIVKNFIRSHGARAQAERGEAVDSAVTLRALTKKPVRPSSDEVHKNSRARSAKMRVAERL